MQDTVPSKTTWVTETKKWLASRWSPSDDEWQTEYQRLGLHCEEDMSPAHVRLFILRWVQSREIRRRSSGSGASKTLVTYLEAKYSATRGFLCLLAKVPGLAAGGQLLVQARVGAFMTATWMAQARLIDEKYKTACPFCISVQAASTEGESLVHFLLQCPRFALQRANSIGKILDGIDRRIIATLTDQDKMVLLLGGGIIKPPYRLSKWGSATGEGGADLLAAMAEQIWRDDEFRTAHGDNERDSLSFMQAPAGPAVRDADSEKTGVACCRVALYFQDTMDIRRKLLFPLTQKRADAPTGMASLDSAGT